MLPSCSVYQESGIPHGWTWWLIRELNPLPLPLGTKAEGQFIECEQQHSKQGPWMWEGSVHLCSARSQGCLCSLPKSPVLPLEGQPWALLAHGSHPKAIYQGRAGVDAPLTCVEQQKGWGHRSPSWAGPSRFLGVLSSH